MAAVIVTTTAPRRSIDPVRLSPAVAGHPGRAIRGPGPRPGTCAPPGRCRPPCTGAGASAPYWSWPAWRWSPTWPSASLGCLRRGRHQPAGPVHAATAQAGGRVHVVQPGDTVWSIARSLHPHGDIRIVVDRLETRLGGATLQPGQRVPLDGLTS